jgi:hypothetical protein
VDDVIVAIKWRFWSRSETYSSLRPGAPIALIVQSRVVQLLSSFRPRIVFPWTKGQETPRHYFLKVIAIFFSLTMFIQEQIAVVYAEM